MWNLSWYKNKYLVGIKSSICYGYSNFKRPFLHTIKGFGQMHLQQVNMQQPTNI